MQRILSLGLWLVGITGSLGQVLYNINFNNQPANSLVQTGAPPQYISSVNFGTPTVVGSFGGLHDQPLRLGLGGPAPFYWDQIQLNFSTPPGASLDLSFDFTSVGLVGGSNEKLEVFDIIGAGSDFLGFDSSGLIYASNGQSVNLGQFTDNETFRILIHMDVRNQKCIVYKDGVMLGNGAFPCRLGTDNAFRFNHATNTRLDSGAVGIDNILLMAVPEPSVSGLAGLAGLAVMTRKLRLTNC
jgi:hypothetical protein